MLHYDITLHGGVTGAMWWPVGVAGGKSVRIDLTREEALMESPTLRELLDHVLMRQGGDFQGATFTGDTFIEVTSRKADRRHTRSWDITSFPSVADMVSADVYLGDFMGEDD